MSKVTISEAIRMVGVSRSHFYGKYINKGILSVVVEGDKKMIDVSELIRVFGNVQLKNVQIEQMRTPEYIANTTEKDKLIKALEQQIEEFRCREKEAKDREEWLHKQIDELRHQQSYLLENKLEEKTKRKKFLGIF